MRPSRLKSAKSDGDSEVKKIEKLVRLRITQGLVPSPNYRLSARKLAKEFKVSRDTTWRALRLLAAEQWVQIGRQGGFQVHPSHWPDRKHLPICRVAFLADGDGKISGSYFSAFYAELAAVAPEHRLEIAPVCVPYPQTLDASLLAGFDVVVLTASWARTFFPITESLQFRTIGLECGLRDHVANTIRTDFFRGGEMLGHLLMRHKPNRAVVFVPACSRGVEEEIELRALGFLKAWVESGRIRSEVLEVLLPANPSAHAEYITRHVESEAPGTVYFPTTLPLAHLTLNALKLVQVKVPQEPVVGTFDLLDEGARPIFEDLAVVQPNVVKMATVLAESIRKLFMSEKNDAVGIVNVPPIISKKWK
jgi:hypothetical protein